MITSEAQKRATQKYISEKTYAMRIYTDKKNKQILQAHAAAMGESLNAFVNRAIAEALERDKVN